MLGNKNPLNFKPSTEKSLKKSFQMFQTSKIQKGKIKSQGKKISYYRISPGKLVVASRFSL